MSFEDEIYITSRSRTPSLIDVTSHHERVFKQLPDLIQEAIVSKDFSSSKLQISRVQNENELIETGLMTTPMFFITHRTDSGIDLPNIEMKDEKILGKYGAHLTANFADIKAYGAKAFFQKKNLSDGAKYSLCACATGYIWVYATLKHSGLEVERWIDVEVQIGSYALKAEAITTVELPFRLRPHHKNTVQDGELAVLCSTVLAKYLRLRMMGHQYEEAARTAASETRKELKSLWILDRDRYDDYIDKRDQFQALLRSICANVPMPPTSGVSLISRNMITRRWECWRESSVLRKRYWLPGRLAMCFRHSQHDSIDLLSGCFKVLKPHKSTADSAQTSPRTSKHH